MTDINNRRARSYAFDYPVMDRKGREGRPIRLTTRLLFSQPEPYFCVPERTLNG